MSEENKVEVTLSEAVKAEFSELGKSLNTIKKEATDASENVKKELNTKLVEQGKIMDKIEEKVNMLSISQPGYGKDPNKGFKNHVDFYKAVIESGKYGNRTDKMDKRLIPLFNAVGSDEARESSNPAGGFLPPPTFFSEPMKLNPMVIQEDSGSRTRKIPMASKVVYLNALVDKDHSTSYTGGFRMYRREETATVEASKATYEQIKMEANPLMGISYATEELIQDSPISFAATISNGLTTEKICKLNNERIRGTGVGEYEGILNSDALVTVAKESSQGVGSKEIIGKNIVKMRQRIFGYQNAVWFCNQDAYESLTSIHIAGTNTDKFLFSPENGTDIPATLLGRPVIFDENMSTLGTVGDIMLINFNEYYEGFLGGGSFMESAHVRFLYNERTFRFTVRCDGQPAWKTVLTPRNSTSTLSPFVALATR